MYTHGNISIMNTDYTANNQTTSGTLFIPKDRNDLKVVTLFE